MEHLILVARPRTILGKQVKRMRRAGRTPGMLYGHGQASQPIDVDTNEFVKVYRQVGNTTLLTVSLDGKETQALIRDVDVEPIKRVPLHVDLYQVRMDEPVTSSVPIVFTGNAPAVSQRGGVLLHLLTHVAIRCLPGDLPPSFHLDVTSLTEVDQALTIADLPAIAGVEILADAHEIVAKVMPPKRVEEEEIQVPAPAPAAPPEPSETEPEAQ